MPAFLRRRSLLSAACSSALGLLLAAGAALPAAAQTLKTEKPGVLSIANSGHYPPMEFVENGKLVGYDIDMGNEIAKRLGLKPDWVVVEYKGIIGTLKSKRTDILISSMTITPARAEQVLFSDGYLDADIGAAVRKADGGMTAAKVDPKDVIGVEIGSAGAAWAKDHFPNGNVKVYDNLMLAIKDLDAGRVRLVVNNLPALEHQTKDMKGLAVTSAWEQRMAGIALRKEDTEMAAAINKVIGELKAEGFLKKLGDKWYGGQ
jgi:ABC-type amino acid transport substrate-binding protein